MTTEQTTSDNSGPGYATHPEHSIRMQPFNGQVLVTIGDTLLANSNHAILLTEADYSPVYYVPRADVSFEALAEIDLSTYCPFKGHARYWRLEGTDGGDPVVWGYDDPYDEVDTLSGYVAFYADRVVVNAVAA